MTETEAKTCQCAEPELRVYSTTYRLEHKVQYCKCLKCKLPARKKTPLELAVRVAILEAWKAKIERGER